MSRRVEGSGGGRGGHGRPGGDVPVGHAAPAADRRRLPRAGLAAGAGGGARLTVAEVDARLEAISRLEGRVRRSPPRRGGVAVRGADRARAGVPPRPHDRQRPPGRARLGDARRDRAGRRPARQGRTSCRNVQRADRTGRDGCALRRGRGVGGLHDGRRAAGAADAGRFGARRAGAVEKAAVRSRSTPSSTASGSRSTSRVTTSASSPAASTRSGRGCPRWWRSRGRCRRPT